MELIRVFNLMAQEGFLIHETESKVICVGRDEEGVILWFGFNWLKTVSNVQIV